MSGFPAHKHIPEEENVPSPEKDIPPKDSNSPQKRKGRKMSFRERLQSLLGIKDSPHKIASSFSVGTFIGMSPLLGLHTVLGIIAGYLFRLNMVATMTGVYVTNPWTIIPIYTFTTWVGTKILGVEFIRGDLDFSNLTLSNFVSELEYLLKPFIVGSFTIALISSLLLYFLIRKVVRKVQSGK